MIVWPERVALRGRRARDQKIAPPSGHEPGINRHLRQWNAFAQLRE
jgi:hypothetical protein